MKRRGEKSILSFIIAFILLFSMTASSFVMADPLGANEDIENPETLEAPTIGEPLMELAAAPTVEPTEAPTVEPTEAPTVEPTEAPTVEPTEAPIVEPTKAPLVESEKLPITLSTETEGIRIEVFGEAGVIPEGAKLLVTRLSNSDYGTYIEAIEEAEDIVMDQATMFDITILDASGNEVQPNGEVVVSFHNLENIAKEDGVVVYHVNEEEVDIKVESMETTVEDEKVSFSANHFSIYVVGTTAASEINLTLSEFEGDPNFIIVQKKFVGISKEQIPVGFQITVNSGSKTYTLTKDGAPPEIEFSESEDGLIWRWRINNAGVGTYSVTESGTAVDNYTLVTTGDTGTVSVSAAEFAVDRVYYETTCSKDDWPVFDDTFFVASLTKARGSVVITYHTLSAAQRLTIANYILNDLKDYYGGPWKGPVYFYSVDEQDQTGNGFTLGDVLVTYNHQNKEVHFSSRSNWQHVATLKYNQTQAAQNPEIEIINTYTKATTNVRIDKEVTGNFGDYSRNFEFEAKVMKADGITPADYVPTQGTGYTLTDRLYTFDLKHGDGVTLVGLPKNGVLWLKETNASSYTVTVTSSDKTETHVVDTDGWYKIPIPAGGLSVVVENHYDVTIQTGIFTDSLPYLIILTFVMFGLSVIVIRKRIVKTNADWR